MRRVSGPNENPSRVVLEPDVGHGLFQGRREPNARHVTRISPLRCATDCVVLSRWVCRYSHFGEPTSYLAPLRFPCAAGLFRAPGRTENCSLVGLQPGWVTVCFNAVPCCAFPARIPALCNRFCGNVGVGCRVAAHMADLAPLRRGFFVRSCRVFDTETNGSARRWGGGFATSPASP